MESWKNSYYLRDLDDFIISGSNGGRNDSEAKVEHSPFIPITTANDDNVGELDPENPNPVRPPVRGTKPIDTEPAPDNPPGNGNTPGDTDDNPIEPNPNNPPIKKPKPAEPTPTPPPEPAPTDPKPGQDETQPPENDGGGNGRNDGDDRDGDDDSIERGDHRDDDDNNSNSGTGGGNGNNGENQTPPAAGNTGNNGNTGNQTTPSPADTKSSAGPNTGNGRNKDLLSKQNAKAILGNRKFSPINLTNDALSNEMDLLSLYSNNKNLVNNKSFNDRIAERGGNMPMQRDKNGNVIYHNTCQYASAVGAINLSGYDYKKEYTKEKVEEVLNDAVSGETCKPYTEVIKEIFGLEVVCHEIPAGLSETELRALVGDNPAVIKFRQTVFWGNDQLPEEGVHGIGYSSGGFIEPYMGRNGESWEDVRGSKCKEDFTANLGGFYFEIKK